MYYLPWWMQWGQVIGVAAISGLGAWIAYKQVRIGTAKLNLDLFDRRFKVFEAGRNLIGHIIRTGTAEFAEIQAFNFGVVDAVFLFDSEVEDYLMRLRKISAALHIKNEQLKAAAQEDPKRSMWAEEVYEMHVKVEHEYEKLVSVFKPYLKLGNI